MRAISARAPYRLPTTVAGTKAVNMVTKREWMTMEQVLEELGVPLSTMSDWRREGRGPVFSRLPNGKLRIPRDDFNAWCDSLARV